MMEIKDMYFQGLFEQTNDAVFILDLNGVHVKVNRKASEILGYSPEEMKNLSYKDLSAEANQSINILDQLLKGVKLPVYERIFRKKNGDLINVEINVQLIQDADRKPLYIQSVIRDITNRKKEEKALIQSEESKKILLDNIQTQIWYLTNDYTYGEVNKAHAEFNGMQIEDIAFKNLYDIFPADIVEVCRQSNKEVFTTRKTMHTKEWVPHVSGEKRLVSITKTPKLCPNGSVEYVVCSADDITDQEIANEKVKSSEAHLNALVSNTPAVIYSYTVDIDGVPNLTYINNNVTNILGFKPEDFVENMALFASCVHPEDMPKLQEKFTGKEMIEEYRFKDKNGDYHWLLDHQKPYKKENGKTEIIGVWFDNTERKEMEQQLKESQISLKIATEGTETGIWDWDMINDSVTYSLQWKKMLGYEDHEVENAFSGWKNLWHPDDAASIEKAISDYLTGKTEKYEIIHRCRHKDGGWRWIVTRGTILKDNNNKPYRWVGTNVDVTKIKQLETQLFQKKEQFKTTILSVSDGIISTDVKGKVLIFNSIAEQLTGWTYKETLDRSSDEIFHIINEFTRERCDNPVQKALYKEEIIELDNHTKLISKDGIERFIEGSTAPIKDEQGKITGVVLVFRDYTEKKKSQDEIKHLSFHDYLTGLYNRRFYEIEKERLDTERNLPITIIMGDVNGLKLINDSFGHTVGDDLLISVAKVLKKCFRSDDIIARVGGDEYAILLLNTDGSEAQKLIDQTIKALSKEKVRDLDVSISFGLETKTNMSQTIDLVTKKAEDYMYNNKLFDGPSLRGKMIDSIVTTFNAKNLKEQAHSERVSELCVAMGEELKLEGGEIKTLKVLGLLHDIGKIVIDNEILNKPPDELTDKEYNEIKRHSEIGFRILSTANDMSEIAKYVLFHHERWDGKGYPKGLKGDSIPLPSRICAIADAYDSMTSDKSYRHALTNDFAVEELQKNSGTQFDSELVDLFLKKVIYKNNIKE